MSHEPKMTCHRFRKLLKVEYLSEPEIEELGEHVERCQSCDAFISRTSKDIQKLEEELRQIKPKDPGPVPPMSRRRASRIKEGILQEAHRRLKQDRQQNSIQEENRDVTEEV